MRVKITQLFAVAYFVLLFLFSLFLHDILLYYHFHQPIFLFDSSFIAEHLIYPGGPIELAAQFILQFMSSKLIGAAILSFISLFLFYFTLRIIQHFGGGASSHILVLAPFIFYLILISNYSFSLIIAVKYLATLGLFLVYRRCSFKFGMLLLGGLYYYILGGWLYLFYIILCALHDLFFEKSPNKFIFTGLNLFSYIIFPFLAVRFLFILTPMQAYFYAIPKTLYHAPYLFKPDIVFLLWFLMLPLMLIFIRFGSSFLQPFARKRRDVLTEASYSAIQAIVVLLVASMVLLLSHDSVQKAKLKIDYYAATGQWQNVLNTAQQLKTLDRLSLFHVNRALCHRGQLLDKMFYIPQMYGTDALFLNKIMANQITLPSSDLYFELGEIKAAQVMAFEGQTKSRYDPRFLKRLVQTSIILEQYKIADKFLKLLNKSLVHRKWAREHKKRWANETLIAKDPLIAQKRAEMPTGDFFISTAHPYRDLLKTIAEKPENKKALEYLVAYSLLDCRLGQVISLAPRLQENGKRLPRHVEEALLVAKSFSPNNVDLSNLRISRATLQRFIQFAAAMKKSKTGGMTTTELKKAFLNTYWIYFSFLNPQKTGLELKKRKIDESIL